MNNNSKTRLLFISTIILFSLLLLIQCATTKNNETIEDNSSLSSIRQSRLKLFREKLKPDGTISADLVIGKDAYYENCYACHGEEGNKILASNTSTPRVLAITAYNNPELFYMLANFGEPNRRMLPYYEEISAEDLIAITAYVQTLPQKDFKF